MTENAQGANEMAIKYQRAQTLMQGFFSHPIVPNSTLYPVWIEGSDCFWYERQIDTTKGRVKQGDDVPLWDTEYRLVNASAASNTLAFDHSILADSLAEVVKQAVNKNHLPIKTVAITLDNTHKVNELRFTAFDKAWVFEPQSGSLRESSEPQPSIDRLRSPDGRSELFTRDYNLWLQDLASGEEHPLTHDGEEDYCYTVGGNAWGNDHPNLSLQARWSADSKQVFTVQRDSRQVLSLPVVEHVPLDGSIRPTVRNIKMPMPGDAHIPTYRLVAIDIASGRLQPANYRPLPLTRNSDGFFDCTLGWWGSDNRHAYFVDMERDYQTVRVVEFDTHSGATRILFEETSATHISLMLNQDEYPTIVPLPQSHELIWFSERSGWAHLYLYDLNTGQLKHPITEGEWVVRDILAVDSERRELFVQTMGRTPNRDPYYRDVVRIDIDTGELTTVVSGDYDHYAVSALHLDHDNTRPALWAAGRDIATARSVSHRGDFVVVNRSRADSVPVSLLLDRNGQEILEIEKGDLAFLKAAVSAQWQWPEPVKLLAADGTTDIYGLVFRPSDFSPEHSYPIVTNGFNTPELSRVAKGAFSNGTCGGYPYLEAAALAELGFIVVQIDGRGTPYRHKAFHDESYGWMESASHLDDHVAGIRQLAERYPYMDLNRVGAFITNGPGAVQGLLHYPELFKVGVQGVVWDSRLLSAAMMGEKYEGLAGSDLEPSSWQDKQQQYPENYADRLQGKLLLIHGMLGVSVPVAGTFRMIEAFQKANKDFDLLLLPNVGHGICSGYTTRRAWDYLVRYLLEEEPPKDFKLVSEWDRL